MATVSTKQDLIREDVKRLHGLGYAQELFREMGGFSNFAISFTIISILTGTLGIGAVPYILQTRLGSDAAFIIFGLILVAQFLCVMSSVTANSRMIYAFSRDGAVPGHRLWHTLNKRRIPGNAVWLAALGYTARLASELEFYLFKETFESARAKHYHDLRTYGTYIADYHILQTTKEEGIVRQIRWGHDNRTCGLRVIGEHGSLRVENRVPGADANPYLAFAATLAAGIAGIQRWLPLPDMFTGDAYEAEAQHHVPRVPGALYEAIHGLEHSQLAREAFGERVVAHYLNAAQQEQAAYDHAVTCWELDRYFERI
ncbi:MAG TPA: amino acid permease [Ktedonobacterales bacterium]|nr:amino acid permease [Ktedonobacterales bacterium]